MSRKRITRNLDEMIDRCVTRLSILIFPRAVALMITSLRLLDPVVIDRWNEQTNEAQAIDQHSSLHNLCQDQLIQIMDG
jgi:hypothetical protein